MSIPGINIEDIGMPTHGKSQAGSLDPKDYRVRYFKADISDAGDLGTLELIETEALEGTDKILLSKDKFSFQDNFFVVITYLEKR